MKLNINAGWSRDHSTRVGFFVSINSRTWTLRKIREYEGRDGLKEYRKSHGWRNHYGRGLTQDKRTYLPKGYVLHLTKEIQDAVKACGLDFGLDWVIDEYDSSFDEVAKASLRYHLNYAVTAPQEGAVAALYQEYLERFESLSRPLYSEEEYQESVDIARISSQNERDFLELIRKREDERAQEQVQVRKDFIEHVVPSLWS